MKYIDYPLREYNKKLAEGNADPAGGSAAALSLSLSAALLSMVIKLSRDNDLAVSVQKVEELCTQAEEIVDQDPENYSRVMAAFKMPRKTEKEEKAREKEVQEAFIGACSTPLATMEISLELLKMIHTTITDCNPHALADVGAAGELGLSALKSGYYNLRTNINLLKDKKIRVELRQKADDMYKKGTEIASGICKITKESFNK